MIIDDRYNHAGKAIVKVNLDWETDGSHHLRYFWITDPDGELLRYKVEDSARPIQKVSFKAGIGGLRYKVKVRRVNARDDSDPDPAFPDIRVTTLFMEDGKWFLPLKTK